MNTTREQTVVLSFFRFHRSKYLWAMSRMAIVPMQLKKEKKTSFFKMLGTGGGYGYSFKPDFSTYALLTVWDSSEEAKQFESDSDVMRRFHRQAVEVYSIFMRPVQSRGKWSGVRPFNPVQPAEDNVPLAVLTRATLKPYYYLSFWRRVGKVSRAHASSPGTMFTKGVGERPWIAQATFFRVGIIQGYAGLCLWFRNPAPGGHSECQKQERIQGGTVCMVYTPVYQGILERIAAHLAFSAKYACTVTHAISKLYILGAGIFQLLKIGKHGIGDT